MNQGGSREATLTLRQEVTCAQPCSAAVVLNLVRQKERKGARERVLEQDWREDVEKEKGEKKYLI